jgi:hypothetical protein
VRAKKSIFHPILFPQLTAKRAGGLTVLAGADEVIERAM